MSAIPREQSIISHLADEYVESSITCISIIRDMTLTQCTIDRRSNCSTRDSQNDIVEIAIIEQFMRMEGHVHI